MALVSEMYRLRELDPAIEWTDFAVLARTKETLFPIRTVCEHYGIPVMLSFARSKTPSFHRMREIAGFLDDLKTQREKLMRASQLEALLSQRSTETLDNPWRRLLIDILASWREETGDAELPVSLAMEAVFEHLVEQRRDQAVGSGVFLGTVHSAKGLEFPHVFVPDGDWRAGRSAKELEEERRTFYVAMTRAKDSLCLFERADARCPHLESLEGEAVLKRPGPAREKLPDEILKLRYELLGMQDIYLSFAGRRPPDSPIHAHLAALQPGSRLMAKKGSDRIELLDEHGVAVSALSHSASRKWLPNLDAIKNIRVIAMLRRYAVDSGEEYRKSYRCESWEAPWIEIISVR